VQRALVDVSSTPTDSEAHWLLGREVDALAEAVAAIRLVVEDPELVRSVEAFEAQAKRSEGTDGTDPHEHLLLTPLIDTLRAYEISRQ
jgi:hypothetical protein